MPETTQPTATPAPPPATAAPAPAAVPTPAPAKNDAPQPAAPAQPAAPVATPAPAPVASVLGDGKPPETPTTATPAKPLEPLLPADFKIKVPEDVKIDEKVFGEFRSLMADPKMSVAEKTQAIADLQFKMNREQIKSIDEHQQRQRYADLETLKGHPKFGGAFFDKTRADARSILEKSEHGPAVSKKLQAYGLDCDPDFTLFLREIRSYISEDATSGRLTRAAPEVERRPTTQTERMASTYKTNPVVK